jgi:hypothetical protein
VDEENSSRWTAEPEMMMMIIIIIIIVIINQCAASVGCMRWYSWFRHCATVLKITGSVPDGVSGVFFIDIFFRPQYRSEFDLAPNINEYQERFPGEGCKGGRCVGLTTLPLSCADYLKIWELQPPGTFRARIGIALTLQQVYSQTPCNKSCPRPTGC